MFSPKSSQLSATGLFWCVVFSRLWNATWLCTMSTIVIQPSSSCQEYCGQPSRNLLLMFFCKDVVSGSLQTLGKGFIGSTMNSLFHPVGFVPFFHFLINGVVGANWKVRVVPDKYWLLGVTPFVMLVMSNFDLSLDQFSTLLENYILITKAILSMPFGLVVSLIRINNWRQ